MRVAVVGGGIAGLTTAWTLTRERPGTEVVVFEAADRVGGKLRRADLAGERVDVGAEAMLVRRPEGADLVAELGLELVHPLTTAASIRANGALHPVPRGTVMGVPASAAAVADVLDRETLARIEAEPTASPLPPLTDDVAIGALVAERVGPQVVDRLVEPLLAGVYAGRPARLSLRSTVPQLWQALRAGGSLVEAARRSLPPAPVGAPAPVFGSLSGGLGRLPEELVTRGGFVVRSGATVRELRRVGGGFELVVGPVPSATVESFDAVVVAVPPPAAARLLTDLAPDAAAALGAVDLASVAVVSAAFRDVDLPAGSGLLVAPDDGLAVKGVTISSQKWGGAPDGLVRLRMSLGRAGDTRTLQRSDAQLAELALADLATLYGEFPAPVDTRVTRWGGGLPQYDVGHADRVAVVRAAVAEVPALAVAGAAYDGVGVPAVIGSARAAAHRLLGTSGS
ncbi:protoporphyrinogen oxidase [Jatrophihabitans sp. YIM 134969]